VSIIPNTSSIIIKSADANQTEAYFAKILDIAMATIQTITTYQNIGHAKILVGLKPNTP
jgi:hypothetical protein